MMILFEFNVNNNATSAICFDVESNIKIQSKISIEVGVWIDNFICSCVFNERNIKNKRHEIREL